MSKPITKLVFKIAEPKRKRRVTKGTIITKKVMCVCTKSEDGEFKANLRIVSSTKKVTNLLIAFTASSHSCKGKERVFTKKFDKYGKRTCIIRTDWQAKTAPHKSNLYIPFCEDWVYEGYVVRINGQLMFEIKHAIWHKDFVKKDLDIQEDEMKL